MVWACVVKEDNVWSINGRFLTNSLTKGDLERGCVKRLSGMQIEQGGYYGS